MEQGTFNTYNAPVGFRMVAGKLEVDEEEAPTIRRIFNEYLNGCNSREISAGLNKDEALGRVWNSKAVDYILLNERYAGNALLQKRYTTDSFPRQKKRNHGEREMYYVAGSNCAIVSQETFDYAQKLRKERKTLPVSLHDAISRQMRCTCGGRIRAKQVNQKWHWCCCNHDEKRSCPITAIPEAQIQESFCRMYYKLKHQGSAILEQMLANFNEIRKRKMLWSTDIVALNKKISDLSSQNQTLAFLKQQGLVDPDIFISKSNALTRELQQAKAEKEKQLNTQSDMTAMKTQEMLETLGNGPEYLERFDAELFGELVEKIIIESNDSVRFVLKNELEVQESIERTVR